MKILVVSNGMGEDQIACHLIRELQLLLPHASFECVPLVLEGKFYQELGLSTALSNPSFPSGGFIRSFSVLFKDLRAGLLTHVFHQLSVIKKIAKTADLTLAVGDLFCLLMARHRNTSPIFFLPTAKSDTFMKHGFFEKCIMKFFCKHIFPRDSITADSFLRFGLPASYLGNVMMDDLFEYPPLELNSNSPVIGVLPGSREEAYLNFEFICRVLETLPSEFQVLVSVPPSLDASKLSQIPLSRPVFFSTNFKGILHRSDLIIGLAGTANEQAMYLNKPVVAFEGFGPQTTLQRFEEQSLLMGGKLHLLYTRNPLEISNYICSLLEKTIHTPLGPCTEKAATLICLKLLSLVREEGLEPPRRRH